MPDTGSSDIAAFADLIDLASERLGGETLAASDDFFAPKENLLRPGRGVFIPDKYTDRGKWMDGWESRRKRESGHDWCIVRLGAPGVIRAADIDTNHFLGNHPPFASLDGAFVSGVDEGILPDISAWQPLLPQSPLRAGSRNLFAVSSASTWSHVRLNIFPDGGVARLRIFGEVVPDVGRDSAAGPFDAAALVNGGRAICCSDMFFSPMENLIMPGRGVNMGDGWESRRRRGPGHDWVILKLAMPVEIERIEIDTHHFKGNFPDSCALDVCLAPDAGPVDLMSDGVSWRETLPDTPLRADAEHRFEKELRPAGEASHVRLRIYPDGGVSRLRVFGRAAR